MLRVVVTRITKLRLQGNRSGLRKIGIGYSPRIGIHKMRKKGQVRLRLVLVQKRTRLEFLRCNVGCLYTWERPNTVNTSEYKYNGKYVIAE
jgi:hypothetical protein